MTYKEAVICEIEHIIKYIDDYDEDDVFDRLQGLKICMLACTDGNAEELYDTLDEDELLERKRHENN